MGKVRVEMTYHLDFLPTGIMSWFIVRTHRYTHHLHWREGVVLTYNGHLARIELFPRRNELHWDGLRRVITEDGNVFWLCEKHAYPYRVQPLQIR